MSFQPNPLSLSVPDPNFESWLRDSGFLDILDHKTTQLHTLHTSSPTTTPTTAPTTATAPTITITAVAYTLTMSLVSSLTTLLSLLTVNPFAKLTSSDFASGEVSWTRGGFLGSLESYSYPSSATQVRMRVHENVKRFARHYAVLSVVVFACSLYQMPLALFGLLSCLAVWELFRFCDARWALERFPSSRQLIIRVGQCAAAGILLFSNVQVAVFCTVAVSYAVLIMHASFRKLTTANQPLKRRAR